MIERQGRIVQDLGRRHGTLFHQDGHRSGSLEMAGRMFGLLGPDALMSHCTDLTDAGICLRSHRADVHDKRQARPLDLVEVEFGAVGASVYRPF